MISIERASESEQTLLKHYSLKINRLRDTEGKNYQTKGSCQFLIRYDYKKYSPKNILLLTFTINFFILFQLFTFVDNKIYIFQALRRYVLLFGWVVITP